MGRKIIFLSAFFFAISSFAVTGAPIYAQTSSGDASITVVDGDGGGGGKWPTIYTGKNDSSFNQEFPGTTNPGSCNKNSVQASFYYTKSKAVRNGIVPFRILLNTPSNSRKANNPHLIDAVQLIQNADGTTTRTIVDDPYVEVVNDNGPKDYSYTSSPILDGYIYMKSADEVILQFDVYCPSNGGGYNDYIVDVIVATYKWTIPDGAQGLPTPTPVPTPCAPLDLACIISDIFPTPTPPPCVPGEPCVTPPCQWWDVACIINNILPTSTPCPEGVACITPPSESLVDNILSFLHLQDIGVPNPTKLGEALLSALCNMMGCNKDSIIAVVRKVGPAIAAFLAAAATLAAIPGIITNILPQLANGLQFLGSFFTLHHRKARWGVVVDSDLGRPIARAIVQVFDAVFNQLKETQITGPDGQFGFLLPPGKYYVIASDTGFTFPARKKPPTALHEGERLYLGEEFESNETDKIPHLIVPMDREEKVPFTKMIFLRYTERVLAFIDRIGFISLVVGMGINTFFLLIAPGRLNIFFEALYVLLFALKLYLLFSHQRGVGDVVDAETNKPIDLAIIRLYDALSNQIVQTRVTNVHGKLFLLVPHGTYTASVAKPGYKTLIMENISSRSRGSKALALQFKLIPEVSEGTTMRAVSSPVRPSGQTFLNPNPAIASKSG